MSHESAEHRSEAIPNSLVVEIIAINKAWKASRELLGSSIALTESFRHLKSRLQARLLRRYAPQQVYLELDTTADSEEPLYGLKLVNRVGNRTDVAHMPVRIANELFSAQELQSFTKESQCHDEF